MRGPPGSDTSTCALDRRNMEKHGKESEGVKIEISYLRRSTTVQRMEKNRVFYARFLNPADCRVSFWGYALDAHSAANAARISFEVNDPQWM